MNSSQSSPVISVAVPLCHEPEQPLTDPFFMEMLAHLAEGITRRGYAMLLRKILPPMDGWLTRLIDDTASVGIIVLGQSTEHAAIQAAAADYQPLVVWGGRQLQQSYCSVGTDNVEAAKRAVEHLITTGRRRIVFFGDTSAPEIQLRLEGYRAALASGPAGLSAQCVVSAPMRADAAYEAMRIALSESTFDAVFASTDILGIAAIRAITAGGWTVPADISVIGFDDIVLASRCNPTLSTMRQDFRLGADTLVDLLFRRLRGESTASAWVPAELIVRESSAFSTRS